MAVTARDMLARGKSPVGIGVISLTASILSLGANWPMLKIALSSMTPLWFTEGRLFVPGLLYVVALALQGRLRWPPRSEWPIIILIGVFQSALMITLITIGVHFVGAGRSAILTYTMPIWIVPGAVIWLGERISRAQILGLAIGIDWTNRSVILGNACVLLGSLTWSISLLGVRGHRWRVDVFLIMPFQTLLGALLLLPVAGFAEGWLPAIHWSMSFLLSFAYVCVIGTFLAFWFVVEASRRLPAIQVSLAQLGTPVIGIIASALWINEAPTLENVIGLAFIIVGVVIATIFAPKHKPQR
jgi:drug/metabolite transporter (DMT)-like permease